MQNGRRLKALSLAVSLALLGGCGPTSTASLDAALAAQVAELPDGRYQVDPQRGRVWFLTYEGVFVHEMGRPERRSIPLPGWVSAGPTFGCLPDLALGPHGEAVVTSNVMPTVWKIDPRTLVASAHPLALDAEQDKDIGFTGLVYSPQHRGFLAASFAPGMLWRIDGRLERAEKVALSAPILEACGLAVRPRTTQQTFGRSADVCVRTPRGGWSVSFAPDWRSAHVSAQACSERAWPMDTAWLQLGEQGAR